MRSHSLMITLIALAAAGCASMPPGTPPDLPSPGSVRNDPYGSYIYLDHGDGWTAGELLAIERDSTIYVMTAEQHAVGIDAGSVTSAQLIQFDASPESVAGLAALGTLATISNGAFLVFTAPLWIIVGTAGASARSHEPIIVWPRQNWGEFVPFARFPTGLPAGFITGPPRSGVGN
ncbi:MAG TPA: hypothetical protein VFH88_06715 [Candidatus Krumholzibacteria bacterium]|nr:hypothetical protein [Candidatus Krumholzibacteria bacterium]